jgi:hypothetical protein
MKTRGVSYKSIFCDRTLKVVFEGNAQFAPRDASKMTHRCQGLVIASKIFGPGFGFGKRFDDDE